jgi:hypothetical protein
MNPTDEPAFLVGFRIHVLEMGDTEKTLYTFTPHSKSDVDEPILVKVDNPTTPGIGFLQSASQPDRNWGRVPDLEGPLFHNRKLEKKTKNLRPRVYVDHGTFFTYDTTSPCKFRRVADNAGTNSTELNEIAYLPAAELAPGPLGHVSLTVQEQEIRFYPPAKGKTVVILFINMCPHNICKYNPQSDKKEERNDFHMYYRTFKKPSGHPEFHLINSGDPCPTERINARQMRFSDMLNRMFMLSSRNAPCGGISFGQSDGLG